MFNNTDNNGKIIEKISIILPTRLRCRQVNELVESIFINSENTDYIEVCIYIDNDDVESKCNIDNLITKYSSSTIKYVTSPEPLNLSEMWNYAYNKLATGNIIMQCGDDIRFRTKNWDTIIRNEFDKYDDKIVLIFGKDGIQNQGLATHSFVHRRWIEVSGFWLPPYFVSDFNDLWLDQVSRMINRRVYLGDIYTEHMHYVVGKAEIDDNTRRRLERHKIDKPELIYASKEAERSQHARILLHNIQNFSRV